MENKNVKFSNILKIKEYQKKESQIIEYVVSDNIEEKIIIEVYPNIDITKRITMVDDILDIVIINDIKDYNIENYKPSMLNFAKRFATLSNFTNIELEADIKDVYEVVMHTDIYQKVYEIAKEELDLIFEEVDKMIKAYIKTCIYNKNFNALVKNTKKFLIDLEKKLEDINLDTILEKLNNPNIDFQEIVNKLLNKTTDDTDNIDLTDIVSTLTNK